MDSGSSVGQQRIQLFTIAFSLFLAGLPVLLWIVGRLSLGTYLTLSFVWLLIISEVFAPSEVDERWWRRLRWLKIGGWAVVAYFVTQRVLPVIG